MDKLATEAIGTAGRALAINMDSSKYGTFAEIGAGQEVGAWFFRVGGAAGTIAQSISAYDMTVSDRIYGKSSRYVSCERLQQMLDFEYSLLIERLAESRGDETTFFAFADSVSARNFHGTNECHGWLGIRFQTKPGAEPNQIVLHVNMLDRENILQQQALGILGVNMVWGAFHLYEKPLELLQNLLADLSVERIEIDVIDLQGPDFSSVDNRVLGIKLVRLGLTQTIVFDEEKVIVQPSSVVRKRPILTVRGSLTSEISHQQELLTDSRPAFLKDVSQCDREPCFIFETTMQHVDQEELAPNSLVLERVDALLGLGMNCRVMISRFGPHYELCQYLRRYTKEIIGFPIGSASIAQIFEEKYYELLPGRLLEGLGRLFADDVKIYACPLAAHEYRDYLSSVGKTEDEIPVAEGETVTVENLMVTPNLKRLYRYLLEAEFIVPV